MIKILIGDSSVKSKYSFRPSTNRAFTDTGTTFVLLPEEDYNAFVDFLCNYLENKVTGPQCMQITFGLAFSNCDSVGPDSNLPNVYI